MRKAIQHTLAAAQSSDRLPVVFLVQKRNLFFARFRSRPNNESRFQQFLFACSPGGQILQRKEPLILLHPSLSRMETSLRS